MRSRGNGVGEGVGDCGRSEMRSWGSEGASEGGSLFHRNVLRHVAVGGGAARTDLLKQPLASALDRARKAADGEFSHLCCGMDDEHVLAVLTNSCLQHAWILCRVGAAVMLRQMFQQVERLAYA